MKDKVVAISLWIPLERDDDEMAVLAEPIEKWLDEQGYEYKRTGRGKPIDGKTCIEFVLKDPCDAAITRLKWQ